MLTPTLTEARFSGLRFTWVENGSADAHSFCPLFHKHLTSRDFQTRDIFQSETTYTVRFDYYIINITIIRKSDHPIELVHAESLRN